MLTERHQKFVDGMSDRQLKLLSFVQNAHGPQKRKYTGDPYWEHPVAVAFIVDVWNEEPLTTEIALLHDVVEDTGKSYADILFELKNIGYTRDEMTIIVSGVRDLTDQFTPENYPGLNRAARKAKEASRLGAVPARSQDIKYADLMHNTKSITKCDPSFAKTYLREKRELLVKMNKGNWMMYSEISALTFLREAEIEMAAPPIYEARFL